MTTWEKVKTGAAMKETDYGLYVVLITNKEEQWVPMATFDPDQKQDAVNAATGWLLLLPQGQVAVAQIVAYDTKYPQRGDE